MKKLFVSCLLLALWLSLAMPSVWAIDVGWMQQGVRVWYFGGVGSTSTSDAEEAFLFSAVNGTDVQVTKHAGSNHWDSTQVPNTSSYSFLEQGPCWIHPQVLQNLQSGYNWQGFEVTTIERATYTYSNFPYRLLPAKALFDLKPQRALVKINYMIPYSMTGSAYFDAETGLCLMYSKLNGFVTGFFILGEINYDFATQTAFAEDNGPHTGFKSFVNEVQQMPFPDTRGGTITIQSSVESRYGSTVEMWVSTSECGNITCYMPGSPSGFEYYCFFGNVPILRHMNFDVASNYPPDQWNPYGQYLWWWVPPGALQNSSINVFNVPMALTSTAPYTFTATLQPAGLFFSKLWFDNDGYLTQFAAKDSTTGLDIDPERNAAASSYPLTLATESYYENNTTVYGLSYYKSTMGRATPPSYILALTVVSDTSGKGGGSVHGDGDISCSGHGSSTSGMSGKCQADFLAGFTVNLTQSPDSDSVWATWSVAGCGTNQSCQVLMNGAKNVTVTFPYSPMAKVKSTNYRCDSLALAYGNAAALDTIYGRAVTFTENFTLSGTKAFTLLGGRDAWYQPLNAWTTLQGILTIQNGSLTVENLIIE
jgi:hypothetical protein